MLSILWEYSKKCKVFLTVNCNSRLIFWGRFNAINFKVLQPKLLSHLFVNEYIHGRRSLKWFGGARNFCPKNDLMHRILPKKSIGFFVQNEVISKRKKGHVDTDCFIYFVVCCWFPKERARERRVWMGMLNILGGQNWPKHMKLPKSLMKIAKKIWNCPKFWLAINTLKPRGGPVPPPPPPTPLNTSKTFLICCSGKVMTIVMPNVIQYFIMFF